ncbi:Hypothetical_protein [Hexamita inflata]|uniref:Hypothetical_protein n=1 Tax=Hexamita inflata TaxID=28002 RepID=A0AA86TQE2_9EUKA|nr:Hypothetical protein HINF_LOCUS10517 [Hexamita inflata]
MGCLGIIVQQHLTSFSCVFTNQRTHLALCCVADTEAHIWLALGIICFNNIMDTLNISSVKFIKFVGVWRLQLWLISQRIKIFSVVVYSQNSENRYSTCYPAVVRFIIIYVFTCKFKLARSWRRQYVMRSWRKYLCTQAGLQNSIHPAKLSYRDTALCQLKRKLYIAEVCHRFANTSLSLQICQHAQLSVAQTKLD